MQDDYTAFQKQDSKMKRRWFAVVDKMIALSEKHSIELWNDRAIWQNSISGEPFSRPLTDDEFKAMISSTYNYAAEVAASHGLIKLSNRLFNIAVR